jgi:hypothetical protein
MVEHLVIIAATAVSGGLVIRTVVPVVITAACAAAHVCILDVLLVLRTLHCHSTVNVTTVPVAICAHTISTAPPRNFSRFFHWVLWIKSVITSTLINADTLAIVIKALSFWARAASYTVLVAVRVRKLLVSA